MTARTFENTNIWNGEPRALTLHSDQIQSWSPCAPDPSCTTVTLTTGVVHRVRAVFREFHTWMIGPVKETPSGPQSTRVNKRDLNGTRRR